MVASSNEKLTIAQLARVSYPYHPYGGLEQHVYRLTLELARLGHSVQLYTQPPALGWEQGLREPIWPPGVTHHFVRYQTLPILRRNSIPDRLLNYPLFSLRLAQATHRLTPPPQLVHAHGLTAFGYAQRPLAGVPLVLNPHGMEEFKVPTRAKRLAYAPFRTMLRQAARCATAVIATDRSLLPEVSRFLKTPSERIKLIPNAVDPDQLLKIATTADIEQARGQYKPDPAHYLFLSVGRLEANKGFEVMLEALAKRPETLPLNWRWVVVGTGGEFNSLTSQVARLNLNSHVTLAGRLSDPQLHALYSIADCFVHPTLYEGSSLVTLEAMAHSLPIIASRTGGLPDKVFENGPDHNGWLTAPGDASDLAAKLELLLALSLAERRELGANSRKLVVERFSWHKAALQTVELYRDLLEQIPIEQL